MSRVVWRAMSVGTNVVANTVGHAVVRKGWRIVTGRPVPIREDYEQDRTRDVVIFTALTSALVTAAHVYVERKMVTYYRDSTGRLPAALEAESMTRGERKAHRKLEKAAHKTARAADKVNPAT
jgi:hypothetical protein